MVLVYTEAQNEEIVGVDLAARKVKQIKEWERLHCR